MEGGGPVPTRCWTTAGPLGAAANTSRQAPAPRGASASHMSIPRLQVCSPHSAICELPRPRLPLMSVTLGTQASS